MVATVLSDLALLAGAASPLVFAVAALVLVWRRGFKRAEATLKGMSITLDGIDKAVNSVPAGVPAMKDRVATIERTQIHHSGQIAAIRTDLDAGFAAVHDRLDGFLATDTITAQFDALNQRLDDMAATATTHHPEDPNAQDS